MCSNESDNLTTHFAPGCTAGGGALSSASASAEAAEAAKADAEAEAEAALALARPLRPLRRCVLDV